MIELEEVNGQFKIQHGHALGGAKKAKSKRPGASPTYNSWRAMIARCWHPSRRDFKYYGGRGVQVDPAWLHPPRGHGGFAQFLSDVGKRPEGMTLDRIDVNGHYEPENVRWNTTSQQNSADHRQRGGYMLIDYDGDSLLEEIPENYVVVPKWPLIVVETKVVYNTDPDYEWPF